ncbi:MAG: CDP-alcohol phosphatidyltransferase family protein [Lachnospiraceae bacterium]|nr:CDP-alcohol phosphatidyltransferase family protein [Lachnospiraceae bacterium]
MIGFYDYTVITSYLGVISAVIGMIEACNGRFLVAIICLAFSGMCDTLDGKIARTKKDRTEQEKNFGIQLDSLCDVICFGVFPVVMAYNMGMKKPLGIAILCVYLVCAVIRLAYFNVMEEERVTKNPTAKKVYFGVPITTISVTMSLAYVVGILIPPTAFSIVLHILLVIQSFCFIINIKIPKPNMWLIFAIVLVVIILLVTILVLAKMHIINVHEIGENVTALSESYTMLC